MTLTRVRAEGHGLVALVFTPTSWEVHPTPDAVLRLRRRFWWWCSGMVLAIAWTAIAPPLLRAPGSDGNAYFVVGVLMLFALLCSAATALVALASAFGLRALGLGRSARPGTTPLLVVQASAVETARASGGTITVRTCDGTEFHYSRRGRALESAFANLLGSRLV
ncbi:hypothetical protein [Allokutzneria sp. NRRL B-24872]|uniref:hypothetical protein n=1 Tax=Allokutzneria sp. NRRL B-24872 TaxID=1137961 RepID=UPI000A3D41C2|nr:hypothetical protein [Allokutzneria sp. NRRL B-24872]